MVTTNVVLNKQIEIIEQKVQWAEIKLSEILNRGKRIEAAYFDIESKKARQAIQNCGYDVIPVYGKNGITTEVYYPGRFKRQYVKNGKPFYLGFQSLEYKPDANKYISQLTNVDFTSIRLSENQLLLTRSGTIGQITYVGKSLSEKLFTDDLIRISVSDDVNRGYLYAYLRSKPGFLCVTTNTYGSVVTHIEPNHLCLVPIPNPPRNIKKKISDKIIKAYKLRDEANILIDEAENLMFKKLKLKRIKDIRLRYLNNSQSKIYEIKLSELHKRLDASFHGPLTQQIIQQLNNKNITLTTCGDKRVSKNIILPGRFKRYYVDEIHGIPFLSGKNIFQINPVGIKYLSKQKHAQKIESLMLDENMILITCSGTIGRVMIAPKYFSNFCANQHILRIIPSQEINPGYVYCFLASEYGKELINKFTYGSVVDEIDHRHMAKVPFPIPKNLKLIDEIGNKVLKANALRNEAWKLEKQAISEVEKLIEK